MTDSTLSQNLDSRGLRLQLYTPGCSVNALHLQWVLICKRKVKDTSQNNKHFYTADCQTADFKHLGSRVQNIDRSDNA